MKRPPTQSPRLSLSQLTSCHTKCSLGAAFFFALMVGCGVDPVISTTSSSGSANALQAIAVSGVILQDMQLNVEVPLEVEAFETTELVSKLEGYVGEVLVDIGDEVVAGTVLARLEIPEMVAEEERLMKLVEQAKAQAEITQATLAVAEARREEHATLQKLRQAERERIEKLVSKGALSEQRLEEADFSLQGAAATLARTAADIVAARAKLREANTSIAVAVAAVAKAEALASYREIKAPFAGLITERHVDPGALVRPLSQGGSPLLKIDRVDKVKLVTFIRTDEATRLNDGDPFQITAIQGAPQAPQMMLAISRHAKSIQQGSRLMRAEVDFMNSPDSTGSGRPLKPGDYGVGIVTLEDFPQVTAIPKTAIAEGADGSYIMTLNEDNRCQRVSVKVLAEKGSLLGVAGNMRELHSGQRLITTNPNRFHEGEEIPEATLITEDADP